MTAPLALLVDDDAGFLSSLELLVRKEGFETVSARTLEEAGAALAERTPHVVLVDLELPDGNGWQFVRDQDVLGHTEVIVVTGHASVDSAVAALQEGALDYLPKPFDRSRLTSCLRNVDRTRSLKGEIDRLRGDLRELGRCGPLVGASPAMHAVFDLVARVAPTDLSVLIEGESGVGKELVARAVHDASRRRDGPLLPLNCGAVAPNLIESELFGHERGSFTGAEKSHRGCFERAHGGTLFLDEITEMPAELQVKLLRVLESREITRVGGNRSVPIDVRVLAATNRDPQEAVRSGALRKDLYYRLNVFPIAIPPLRERAGDVRLLAGHFLDELNREHGTAKAWSAAALDRLEGHRFPGNVRELRNLVHRAYVMGEDTLGPEALGDVGDGPSASAQGAVRIALGTSIADAEQRLIEATLEQCGGDKPKAAEVLGISLKTLYTRLKVYAAREAAGETR